MKIEEFLLLAKPEIGKWLDVKDETIQRLKWQLVHHQEETRQQVEQNTELEDMFVFKRPIFPNKW